MSQDERSLRRFAPGFVVWAGTQVVLKAAKSLPVGDAFKPTSSVGVVVESPADNRSPHAGARASRVLEVMTTAMTVLMRLRLKSSDWTTSTGRE